MSHPLGMMSAMRDMDRKIASMAEKQHGVFTWDQARGVGCTGDMAGHRLRTGRWQALAPAVYRLCGSPPTWEQRLMAAVVAAGPTAAASHRSAAALLGIPGFERRGQPEVTSPRARRHRGPATVAHRWRPFPDHHLTVVEGIVTTRVARTLVDLAGVLHPGRTERAVDNCLAAGTVTFRLLHETFLDLAGRGRTGTALMRALLAARGPLYVAPGSELEARFSHIFRSRGLPEPERQVDVGGCAEWIGRVDFVDRPIRVIYEVDGRRYHCSLLDREADARRDAALLAAGWREVVRFGWDDIVDRPEAVVARVLRLRAQAA